MCLEPGGTSWGWRRRCRAFPSHICPCLTMSRWSLLSPFLPFSYPDLTCSLLGCSLCQSQTGNPSLWECHLINKKGIHSAQELACALNTIKSQQQHQQSHDLLQPFSQDCTVQIRPTGLRQFPTPWDLENTALETQRIKFIMKELNILVISLWNSRIREAVPDNVDICKLNFKSNFARLNGIFCMSDIASISLPK